MMSAERLVSSEPGRLGSMYWLEVPMTMRITLSTLVLYLLTIASIWGSGVWFQWASTGISREVMSNSGREAVQAERSHKAAASMQQVCL